uniref:(northern house mosquito) hypothetical protein n=1 Tax=Culex pipiens TaxID=7175 RepID=A0A8D8HEK4_CULPI
MPSSSSPAQNSSKQQTKRQRSDILARVPAISSVFSSFVCAKTRVHPHILPASITTKKKNKSNVGSTSVLPVDYQSKRSQAGVSSFQKDAGLQFTCFQIQFYLCCSFAPFQSRTPLSVSKHFAIRGEIPSKSFVLCSTRNYLCTTILVNAYFHISYYLLLTVFFIQGKKIFSNSN